MFRRIALVGFAASAMLAGVVGIADAQPAGGHNVVCPQSQWYPGDIKCFVSYDGASPFSADWVAVHVHVVDGQTRAWADGYSPNKAVSYFVGLYDGGKTEVSQLKQGGNPPGVSVGDVNATATANLFINNTVALTASS